MKWKQQKEPLLPVGLIARQTGSNHLSGSLANSSYIPWNNDVPWCQGNSLGFLDPPRKTLTGLVSVPGSGNTWLRYLLQTATGLLTGSEYDWGDNDTVRANRKLNNGFPAEGIVNGSVLVIKSHMFDKPQRSKVEIVFDNVIVIIRDPIEAALAEFNRDQSKSQLGLADTKRFLTVEWQDFLGNFLGIWEMFHRKVLESFTAEDIHLVTYDKLKSNPMMELKSVVKFLNRKPLSNDIIQCLEQELDGPYKRKKHIDLHWIKQNLDPELLEFALDLKRDIYESFQRKLVYI